LKLKLIFTVLKTFIYTERICIDAYVAGRTFAILSFDREIKGCGEKRRKEVFLESGEKEDGPVRVGWWL
jgi:hypothetical protein